MAYADDLFHELMIRDKHDNVIYYVRQFKSDNGMYYWAFFDYENIRIDKPVQGVSTISEYDEIIVYFKHDNSTYDVLVNSYPFYSVDHVYSLPLSFPFY